jgi:DNA-binding NtrC family response regulator
VSRLLIVDRDADLRARAVGWFRAAGHLVEETSDCGEGSAIVEDRALDVILVDAGAGAFLTLLQMAGSANPSAIVVVSADQASWGVAVESMSRGAFRLVKRPTSVEELNVEVDQAIAIRRLRHEAQSLRGERNVYYRTDYFVGESPSIKAVFSTVNKIAASSSSVLLLGETGTGKELIAGALHYSSPRARGALVKVNCAALPDQLLESELFGHEKGAFTGAERQRTGRFEQADGGSIFLDEIGDMSQLTQAKVLRVLQEKEFERVGGNRTVRVDVRVISATNRDLEEDVVSGRFRSDLLYRLNVVTIRIPPLRDRGDDVLLLARFFLRRLCADLKRPRKALHPDTEKALVGYHWPGNARELENTIERAVLLVEGDTIMPGDLVLPGADRRPVGSPPAGQRLDEIEKSALLLALEESHWIQKDAAARLGLSRRVLNYKIRRFGITHPGWRRNV